MFVVGPRGKLDYNFQLAFHIAFGNIDPLTGAEVTSTLKAIYAEVERILLGTEAEARRLGLIP